MDRDGVMGTVLLAISAGLLPTGLVYADVNKLKFINDTGGHEAGDKALRSSAEMLVSQFGKKNVYRAGGDEFVVIIPEAGEEEFSAKYEALLVKRSEQYPNLFSSGAYWCTDSSRIEEALRIADQQMYEQKRHFYSTGMWRNE